jgi:hypothetical protein
MLSPRFINKVTQPNSYKVIRKPSYNKKIKDKRKTGVAIPHKKHPRMLTRGDTKPP